MPTMPARTRDGALGDCATTRLMADGGDLQRLLGEVDEELHRLEELLGVQPRRVVARERVAKLQRSAVQRSAAQRSACCTAGDTLQAQK